MTGQIDGQHYEKMPIQPWDIIKANGLDYWEGTIVKYVLRAGDKDGVPKSTDLKKAAHFLREYIQLTEDAENAAHAATPTLLFRCPNGHDVPAVNGNFQWHDTMGEQHHLTGTTCEFSGKYVGLTADEAQEQESTPEQLEKYQGGSVWDFPDVQKAGVKPLPVRATVTGLETSGGTEFVVMFYMKPHGSPTHGYVTTSIRHSREWMDKHATKVGG